MYEWAGQLRYIDLSKSDQAGEQFLHDRWITRYSKRRHRPAAGRNQPRRPIRPGVWSDRAAHYWAAMLHAHPFRVGSCRSIRIWLEDLADGDGHHLRWERSSADCNAFVAAVAGNGDLEPMRALLTQVAGGAPWASIGPSMPWTADGVAAAVAHAQSLASDRVVTVTGGTIARQCLDLGCSTR